VKNGDQFLAQLLIPINLNKLKREDELNVYDAYSADFQTRQEFTLEVKRWKARWELYPTDQVKPSHLCETLEFVGKKWYPHLYCILKIYLTMPPSTQQQPNDLSASNKSNTYINIRFSRLVNVTIYGF
jgi:hypothetical protein